jgi:hypothetical protein
VSFGNTEVKKSLLQIEQPPLQQIVLCRYLKASFMGAVVSYLFSLFYLFIFLVIVTVCVATQQTMPDLTIMCT